MSRSGYIDEMDDQWGFIRYRGAVKSAIRGKRGQAILREMLAALDAMPEKKLIAHELQMPSGEVCAIGSVGAARGIDMSRLDPHDPETIAGTFGISEAMSREIAFVNDEEGHPGETPEQRFVRVRNWIVANLRGPEGLSHA